MDSWCPLRRDWCPAASPHLPLSRLPALRLAQDGPDSDLLLRLDAVEQERNQVFFGAAAR